MTLHLLPTQSDLDWQDIDAVRRTAFDVAKFASEHFCAPLAYTVKKGTPKRGTVAKYHAMRMLQVKHPRAPRKLIASHFGVGPKVFASVERRVSEKEAIALIQKMEAAQ